MYTFPDLIKKIREEAQLTQAEFAKILDISAVLVAMIETGQKEVSRKTILRLSEKMDVHPSSITPFMFNDENKYQNNMSKIEKSFLQFGEQLQDYLIKTKAKKLRQYAAQ